jgi:hypothetical protein
VLESEILTLSAHDVESAALGIGLFLAVNMVVFRWYIVMVRQDQEAKNVGLVKGGWKKRKVSGCEGRR